MRGHMSMNSKLISRNIVVGNRRTSIRLEDAAWNALDDICRFEGVTVNQLCSMIDARRNSGSRTSAVRAYIVSYFHQLALKNETAGRRAGDASALTG